MTSSSDHICFPWSVARRLATVLSLLCLASCTERTMDGQQYFQDGEIRLLGNTHITVMNETRRVIRISIIWDGMCVTSGHMGEKNPSGSLPPEIAGHLQAKPGVHQIQIKVAGGESSASHEVTTYESLNTIVVVTIQTLAGDSSRLLFDVHSSTNHIGVM